MIRKITLALVLMTAPAQAQYYSQPPRSETQYYSPYSYQLQMEQYIRDQAAIEYQRQQRLQAPTWSPYAYENQYRYDYGPKWGCVPGTITNEEACD